jgi:hypothetical protein
VRVTSLAVLCCCAAGTQLVAFVDASHCGSVLDLPYCSQLGRDTEGQLLVEWREDQLAMAAGKVGAGGGGCGGLGGWGTQSSVLLAARHSGTVVASGGTLSQSLVMLGSYHSTPWWYYSPTPRSPLLCQQRCCCVPLLCQQRCCCAPLLQGTIGGQAICLSSTSDEGNMMYCYVDSGSRDEQGRPALVPITAGTHTLCKVLRQQLQEAKQQGEDQEQEEQEQEQQAEAEGSERGDVERSSGCYSQLVSCMFEELKVLQQQLLEQEQDRWGRGCCLLLPPAAASLRQH